MNKLVLLLAVGLGSGLSPKAPGTVGSLLALCIAWVIHFTAWQIALLSLAGVYICAKGEQLLNQHDSPKIVFDEFCGIFIAVWNLHTWPQFLLAFVLFRLLDIRKPLFINRLQFLPHGWGVMADDITAGAVTRIFLYIIDIAI